MRAAPCAILMTTTARRADALRLARAAVGAGLAACVQVVPGVVSIYRWKGKTQRAGEFLVLCKTTKKALPALMKRLKATHPYSLPELVAIPITGGSRQYLSWLGKEICPDIVHSKARRR